MNWLKIAAVAIGALLAFVIVGQVVHIILSLVGFVLIAALVAGGGYVAYKVVTSGRGRNRDVQDRHRDRELRDNPQRRDPYRQDAYRADDLRQQDYAPPPRPPKPDVDDELDRLRREMGR